MQYSSWRGTNILERIKRTWKAALKSGKIKKVVSSDIIQKRSCENFQVFLESEKSAEVGVYSRKKRRHLDISSQVNQGSIILLFVREMLVCGIN